MFDTTIFISFFFHPFFCRVMESLWLPIIHDACSCIKSIVMHLQQKSTAVCRVYQTPYLKLDGSRLLFAEQA